jgi:hypothetical protein
MRRATYQVPLEMTANFIPPHGGCEELLSFRKARIVYDGTAQFCERFSKSVTAPATKWCKRRDRENKIS